MAFLSVLPDMKGFGPALIKGAGKEADKEGESVGKRFGRAINIGVAAIATGAVAAGTALYKIGETFDEVTDTIRVGTGATGADLDALVESAKNVGRNVPAEFEDIGTAVADVNTRLGLTGPTLEKFASQMLEAGRIMGEDLDINAISSAFNVFKLEGEETTDAMDHLFRVSQATGVGMNELATNVSASAPAVQALGFSFEETAALVGNLDKAGLNSSKMMAGMSRALVELAKDGEEPQEAFKRVTGEIQGFIDKGDKASAVDLASKLFGTRNATQFIGALESGALAMDDLGSVAGMTEDTILGAGEETMDFAEQWQMFKNNIMVEVAPAAEWLFAKISDGMKWIKDKGVPALKDFGGWLQKNAGWLKGVGIVIGGVVVAVKAYQAAMVVARVAQTAWTVATKVGAVAMKALNVAMRANPIGLVVTAIMLLVGAFITAYKKSETFRKIVDAAWSGVKKAASAVWNFLRDKVFTPIGKFLKGTGDKFESMKTGIVNAWDAVKRGLKAGWEFVKKWAIAPFKLQIEILKTAFTTAVDGIKGSWDGIKNAFKKVWDWVKTNVLDRFSKGLTNLKDNVVNAVKLIGNGWKNIANKFRNPINWVLDKVWNNGIAKAFNNAAKAINIKTRLTTEAKIPAFAKGGYHRGGWALVGEEGPELVNFSNPGRVYTADQTAAALAGGDGKSPAAGGPVAMGGWLDNVKSVGSAVKDGIVDAVSGAVKWVRGGLADAAAFLLKPLHGLIGNTVGKWGRIGGFAGDAMRFGMDKLVDWIRGKDETEAPGAGSWVRPSAGPITSRYGPRSMFGNSFHAGIDIAGGGPTYAAAGGRVFKTGWNILGGRSGIGIGIDHGGGVFTYYGHNPSMSALRVAPGDAVKAGQRIGAQGATGNVTGTHLHFEYHPNGWGKAVNPERLGIFDQGGWLKPGHMALNLSNRPEPVFSASQWDRMAAGAGGGGPVPLDRADLDYLAERVGDRVLAGARDVSRQSLAEAARAGLAGAGLNRRY